MVVGKVVAHLCLTCTLGDAPFVQSSLGYIPHVYLARMEHQIHRTTPPHTLPVFYLWFFLHNKQCSPNLCVVFSTAISIYTNFLTPKQPLDRMSNQIRTPHIAKIHLTTHRISRSQHALGVKLQHPPTHPLSHWYLNMRHECCRVSEKCCLPPLWLVAFSLSYEELH